MLRAANHLPVNHGDLRRTPCRVPARHSRPRRGSPGSSVELRSATNPITDRLAGFRFRSPEGGRRGRKQPPIRLVGAAVSRVSRIRPRTVVELRIIRQRRSPLGETPTSLALAQPVEPGQWYHLAFARTLRGRNDDLPQWRPPGSTRVVDVDFWTEGVRIFEERLFSVSPAHRRDRRRPPHRRDPRSRPTPRRHASASRPLGEGRTLYTDLIDLSLAPDAALRTDFSSHSTFSAEVKPCRSRRPVESRGKWPGGHPHGALVLSSNRTERLAYFDGEGKVLTGSDYVVPGEPDVLPMASLSNNMTNPRTNRGLSSSSVRAHPGRAGTIFRTGWESHALSGVTSNPTSFSPTTLLWARPASLSGMPHPSGSNAPSPCSWPSATNRINRPR